MRSSSHKHRFAKGLRGALSPPEIRLWLRLRTRTQDHPAFRRQHPIGPYVADFYCSAARLVIEVDGSQHADIVQRDHDAARDLYLGRQGYRVTRIWAADVMADPDAVADGIIAEALAISKRD